ncbi:hypothetical protein LSH36_747g01005 [Paralvinella palmiformis]|uniref:Uncharacterized protein n=1 Tax=Paralvinella palmiformis TaxID=53620 RepID=A0AAD9J1C4_9ANNE|nr:hypothetical protein LSH36_747g01005 [Paralvinella palmiformis]
MTLPEPEVPKQSMNNISNLIFLNHMLNIQVIASTLAGYLQTKWREDASRIKIHDYRMPNFQDITPFVKIAPESANDPVLMKAVLQSSANASSSTHVAKWKSTATMNSFAITLNQPDVLHDPNSNQNTTQRHTNICICHIYHKPHDIDVCYTFLRKTFDERWAFLVGSVLPASEIATRLYVAYRSVHVINAIRIDMDNYQLN